MNPLPGAFLGLCSDFLVFIVISQNHRLTKIRSTNTNGEFMAPTPTYKMEFLVMIVNNIAKSLILDVSGVSGNSYHLLLVTAFGYRCTSLVTGNF